jgi:hypothetical protein
MDLAFGPVLAGHRLPFNKIALTLKDNPCCSPKGMSRDLRGS